MSAAELLAAMTRVCLAGGDVYVAPVDRLNPLCGFSARVSSPGIPDGVLGDGDTPERALRAALTQWVAAHSPDWVAAHSQDYLGAEL